MMFLEDDVNNIYPRGIDTAKTEEDKMESEDVDCINKSKPDKYGDSDAFSLNPEIDWKFIFWVHRPTELWICQVTVAIISLSETILVLYLSYKGNILQQIITIEFMLELINTVPFIVTLSSVSIRGLFIPVFFNCWLAKTALQTIFNDLHRVMQKSQSALGQQLMILGATLLCLVFTSMCGIQHLQRGGNRRYRLIESLWFNIVTFSTVGYGDFCPDIWPSQLFMMVMICVALIVLPTQFEQLAYTWIERQKLGGTYSSHRAQTEKHVVVCTTTLQADTVMDFLNEFYAHPKLQDYFVVLLSPCELDPTMKMLLQVPIWSQRVIYIQGSALKDADLARCRMQDAEACFILAARNYNKRTDADQHTILRSWAVKDFASECPLYVQIFRPESKFHVKFAEHVVCEDEFKYALLANNCLCPATSTLVTLLLHTSRGQEGQTSSEEWQKLYGRHSGNEIYHIKLEESKFFGEYKGKSFTYASFHAHRKYGVSLVGVQQEYTGSTIQLNPGPRHIMKKSDICFYLNITKEENSAFILAHPNQEDQKSDRSKLAQGTENTSRIASMIASVGTVALELQHTRFHSNDLERVGSRRTRLEVPAGQSGLNIQSLQRRPSIAPVPDVMTAQDIQITLGPPDSEEESDDESNDGSIDDYPEFVRGFPPVTPYIGTSPTLCHLMNEKRPMCCLQLANACDHCQFRSAKEYNWINPAFIIASDYASNGLYNFIVPLRSHCRPKKSLNPIVLLLECAPDSIFLETISYFPLVYWMKGSIDNIDHLLKVGINLCDNVVIVNKESSNSKVEDSLADCNTIVAVQTIFRLFPNANIITELSQSSNMRFMQFRAKDSYAYAVSKLEKKEKERGSHLSYMFRLPFAAGNVFSASMLDTLLYQALVKSYLITFVRLLLGIDQAIGSGHLSCMKITKDHIWIRTYGRLYQKLCSTTCEIPIGIYRTQIKTRNDDVTSQMLTRDQSALNIAFKASFGSLYNCDEERNPNMTPERYEISQMVKSRMRCLGLSLDEYDCTGSDKANSVSFVIINPSCDLKLELDDIIYLIKPSSLSPEPSPLIDERRARRSMERREEPTGADTTESTEPAGTDNSGLQFPSTKKISRERIVDATSPIPIIYTSEEDITPSPPEEFHIVEMQELKKDGVSGTHV